MDIEPLKELRDGIAQAEAHAKAHPLGHIGCHPGPPCYSLEISLDAARILLRNLEVKDEH